MSDLVKRMIDAHWYSDGTPKGCKPPYHIETPYMQKVLSVVLDDMRDFGRRNARLGNLTAIDFVNAYESYTKKGETK